MNLTKSDLVELLKRNPALSTDENFTHNLSTLTGKTTTTKQNPGTHEKGLPIPSLMAMPDKKAEKIAMRSCVQETTDRQKLNKTERAFLQYLQALDYPWIGVQNLTLKLADDTRYTPDFFTLSVEGQLIAWEVKGFWRDDAKVKIKVAARQFPWIKFVVVKRNKSYWETSFVNT